MYKTDNKDEPEIRKYVGPIRLNVTCIVIFLNRSLRTTVPLVSYIRNSLRFWYYAALSTCCQNLGKKNGVTGKIWEKVGVKLLRRSDREKYNISTLAASSIRLLIFFLVKRINKRN